MCGGKVRLGGDSVWTSKLEFGRSGATLDKCMPMLRAGTVGGEAKAGWLVTLVLESSVMWGLRRTVGRNDGFENGP